MLAIAVFPFDQANKWSILGTKKVMVSQQTLHNKMESLKLEFHIPVYCLTEEQDIMEMGEQCVDYFS